MARPKGSKNKKETTEKEVNLENYLFIEGLLELTEKVKELIAEKKMNPSVVHEEDAGVVFIEGEPNMVIDNAYLPLNEAKLILQRRKVVREYIKLQNLINNVKD